MGMHECTYIGAYIIMTVKPHVTTEIKSIECSFQHPHKKQDEFCSTCGEKLPQITTTRMGQVNYYDLFNEPEEKEKWEDILQWVGGEYTKKILLIGNLFPKKDTPDCIDSIDNENKVEVELTPEMMTQYPKNFKKQYKDVIEFLTKKAIALEIRFGVLTYYN